MGLSKLLRLCIQFYALFMTPVRSLQLLRSGGTNLVLVFPMSFTLHEEMTNGVGTCKFD